MSAHARKGLKSIRTRTDMTRASAGSHCTFLRLASLELKRALCNRVKRAAAKRIEEVDKQLAEIEAEQAAVLQSLPHDRQDESPENGSPPSRTAECGVRLKY
jgi:hypothetical protein